MLSVHFTVVGGITWKITSVLFWYSAIAEDKSLKAGCIKRCIKNFPFIFSLNCLVLEIWKMGGCHHWWQTTNNWWQTHFCPLQRSNWILASFAGKSLCKVCKNPVLFLSLQCSLGELFVSKNNNISTFFRVCGSYTDMNAGTPAEALVDFTGGVHIYIDLSKPPTDLWEMMCRAGQSKSLMGCGTPQGVSIDIHHIKQHAALVIFVLKTVWGVCLTERSGHKKHLQNNSS